jgi:hypothetical protein
MKTLLIRTKIEEAELELTLAAQQLAEAIREMRAAPRAEKTIPNDLVEGALTRLSTSRAKVVELKTLLDTEDGS